MTKFTMWGPYWQVETVCWLYGKCSKIQNTFLFVFINQTLVFRAGIHKIIVRIANSENPDQTASSV